jgi:hypothetical protein
MACISCRQDAQLWHSDASLSVSHSSLRSGQAWCYICAFKHVQIVSCAGFKACISHTPVSSWHAETTAARSTVPSVTPTVGSKAVSRQPSAVSRQPSSCQDVKQQQGCIFSGTADQAHGGISIRCEQQKLTKSSRQRVHKSCRQITQSCPRQEQAAQQ